MNLKTITKTQLRDFVDAKIANRKRELYDEIKAIVTDRMGEALKTLLGDVSELERVASRFEDLLTDKIHLIGADSVPDYAKTATSEANKLCTAHTYFLNQIVSNAIGALQNPRYNRFKSGPLMDTFNALNTEIQPKLILHREGLDTLKRELHNAVSIEQTGKRAYNALVALGLDMSDIPEANPNLPSVVKLSVDVCVLNGNCAEKKESA